MRQSGAYRSLSHGPGNTRPDDFVCIPVARWLLLGLVPVPLVAFALYGLHRYDVAFALYHAACFGAFAVCGRGRVTWKRGMAYAGWALLFAPLAVLVVSQFSDPERIREAMVRFGFLPWQLPAMAAWFLLINPIAEEAFWRGTIYARMREHMSVTTAAVVSSVLFGAWHALVLYPLLPATWFLGTVAVMGFGAAMAAVFHHNGDELMPGTLFHAIGGDLPLLVVLALTLAG